MIGMTLVMASVTYLLRVVPLLFFRKQIKSKYLYNLFYYLPYAVLAAMTFPYILYSTEYALASVAGTIVALIAAYRGKKLLYVACVACIVACIVEYLIILL